MKWKGCKHPNISSIILDSMNLWGEEGEGIVSNAGLEQIKEVKNKYKIGKKKKN